MNEYGLTTNQHVNMVCSANHRYYNEHVIKKSRPTGMSTKPEYTYLWKLKQVYTITYVQTNEIIRQKPDTLKTSNTYVQFQQ